VVDDEYYAWNVPVHVFDFLMKFMKTPEYTQLREEYEQNVNYKKPYIGLPYPPIFQTVDAVVFCKSHFLVVKRRASPGKGLWAIPGGFLNADERINNGILRELLEETRIKVREDKLVIRETKTFDHPGRSLRGRTITTAGLIILDDEHDLPKVRGEESEVTKVKWIPISKLKEMSDKLFDDHFSILEFFVSRIHGYDF
jgi:bifunctional NMN adenylyltransferase/nudix hydrolase